jgi:hypothetical protein
MGWFSLCVRARVAIAAAQAPNYANTPVQPLALAPIALMPKGAKMRFYRYQSPAIGGMGPHHVSAA